MRRVVAMVVVLTMLVVATAAYAAGPGTPPGGMSPIAGSLYKAQFAMCSLDTLNGLARQQSVRLGSASEKVAAGRLATSLDGGLGEAAVAGCRGGLLYRASNDAAVAGLQASLSQRITAEKYVAGAYALITITFFLWVLIHVGKVTRLERQSQELRELIAERAVGENAPSPAQS